MSRFKSNKIFSGTEAKRLALQTTNVRVGDEFIQPDGSIYEWSGTQWISTRLFGSSNIHDADVHTRPFSVATNRELGTETTVAVAVAVDDYQIEVADSTGFVDGSELIIKEGPKQEFIVYNVVGAPAANVITLDTHVGVTFTTAAEVVLVTTDLSSAAGTIASPQIYSIQPPTQSIVHIEKFLLTMTMSSAGDPSRFGNIASGLTNGAVLRGFSAEASTFFNFTNWKTNGEIDQDTGEVEYQDKVGAGDFGVSSPGLIKISSGSIIRLDGDAGGTGIGDQIQISIQDDITSLLSMAVKFQGHFE